MITSHRRRITYLDQALNLLYCFRQLLNFCIAFYISSTHPVIFTAYHITKNQFFYKLLKINCL